MEGEEGEKEGVEEEVVCMKEVRSGEEDQERRRSTREEGCSEARGGYPMAYTDCRYKEVKIETLDPSS